MALRDILILPDKRLRLKSEPVKAVDKPICARWSTTCSRPCTRRPASGLPPSRLACRSASSPWTSPRRTSRRRRRSSSIRKSLWTSDEKSTYEEGCLSIPEYYEEVERPARSRCAYLSTSTASRSEIEADGLLATCLQHEIDHINGVLFIDYISKLKRDMVMKKFKKAAKRGDRPAAYEDASLQHRDRVTPDAACA